MGCALSLLQGMCLTHAPSKHLCSTRSAFALMLAVVDAVYLGDAASHTQLRLLASHALDTLMCVLVDAPTAVRGLFEHAKGPSIVRRIMNKHQKELVAGDVTGAKCFEFLLFYLQAEAFEEQVGGQRPDTDPYTHPAAVFDVPATPSSRARASPAPTPFYTPMSTPRTHRRGLSHGSPVKMTTPARPPFGKIDVDTPAAREDAQASRRHLRTRSTDERRHIRTRSTDLPSDLLRTPRATPRPLRDTSPTRRVPRPRLEALDGLTPRKDTRYQDALGLSTEPRHDLPRR